MADGVYFHDGDHVYDDDLSVRETAMSSRHRWAALVLLIDPLQVGLQLTVQSVDPVAEDDEFISLL
nr:hypothetical protein [Mycobacterium uberis]